MFGPQEDSRQKKSKSMVRKDMFGDQKPKASAVNTSNKKQNVKTSKVKAPSAPGTGKKATKTELWEDTGMKIIMFMCCVHCSATYYCIYTMVTLRRLYRVESVTDH